VRAIQVCGSMPYDDTDVKKMIRYQTERKVAFSRHKKVSADVKQLIHGILEAKIDERLSIGGVRESTWMTTERAAVKPPTEHTTTTPATTTATTNANTSAGDGLHDERSSADARRQSNNSEGPAVAETANVDASDCRPAVSVDDKSAAATPL